MLRISRLIMSASAALVLLASCGGGKEVHLYPNPVELKSKAKLKKVRQTLVEVISRNRMVEDSPEWIASSYESLHIKSIADIPRSEYASYDPYARGGRAFIIVHPAFYTFFTADPRIDLGGGDGKSKLNVVERLLEKSSALDSTLKLMQEQENILREFMEVIATEKILMVIVLPGNYKKHLKYDYFGPHDEYTRFINEITNESEAVIYVESRAVDDGKLLAEDMQKLIDLIEAAGVKRVYMGGGYIGRCLEGFYEDFTDGLFMRDLDKKVDVFMVPEISAVAPVDLDNKWGQALFLPSGQMDYNMASRNLRQPGAYGVLDIVPNTRRFYIYEFTLD